MVKRKKASARKTRSRITPSAFIQIVLVRHGEAGGEQRPGEVGPPLSPRGRRQAARVGRRLARQHFNHIYSSDMARAFETAAAIRQHHKRTPYTVSKDIREVWGQHIWPDAAPHTKALREHLARERTAVGRFARRLLRHRYGENVLVVAHGNLIRLLTMLLAGLKPEKSLALSVHNTSVTVLQVRRNQPLVVELANSTSHLVRLEGVPGVRP